MNIKQMDIICFSLCCLYKFAANYVVAKHDCIETGEKN